MTSVTVYLVASSALLIAGVLVAAFMPVSLSSNLQGRAEPSGTWQAALGFGFGPVAVTAIAATGVTPFMACHVFGKQLLRVPLSRWISGESKPGPTGEATATATPPRLPITWSRLERFVARLFRSLDPLETALSLWHKQHILQVRSLVVDLEYSFRDVALTGRILAGMYMFTAVLPEHWEINQVPSWESEDRVAVKADAQFRIWPGRLALDVVRFVLKLRAKARRGAAPVSG
ncbi:MAG: hypothetical protein ABJB12_02720 [Pseudomonadota bacterium]